MGAIVDGKTKSVLSNDEKQGEITFLFKDEATGDGGVFDPGANEVMGAIEGKGSACLALSMHFFRLLGQNGIPSHFVSADLAQRTMTAKKAALFGNGLEFICRRYAYGSFLRRFGAYAEKMQDLGYLVEVTLKDDERGDPPVSDDILFALDIIRPEDLDTIKQLTRTIVGLIEEDLARKGLRYIDGKLEFGKVDNQVVVIDEISGDSMRVMDSEGNSLSQVELAQALL